VDQTPDRAVRVEHHGDRPVAVRDPGRVAAGVGRDHQNRCDAGVDQSSGADQRRPDRCGGPAVLLNMQAHTGEPVVGEYLHCAAFAKRSGHGGEVMPGSDRGAVEQFSAASAAAGDRVVVEGAGCDDRPARCTGLR
jgi:hypothetical protein